jgi:hypothetical protein
MPLRGWRMQPLLASCFSFLPSAGRIKVTVPFRGWRMQPLLAARFSFLPSAGRIKVTVPLRGWRMQPLLAACVFFTPSLRGSDKSDCPPQRGILHFFYSTIRWPNLFCDNPSLRGSDNLFMHVLCEKAWKVFKYKIVCIQLSAGWFYIQK